jgi:hypothetical protein
MAVAIGLGAAGFAASASASASAPKAPPLAWVQWKTQFTPLFKMFETAYINLGTALNANGTSATTIEQDFVGLSNTVVGLASGDDSPSAALNKNLLRTGRWLNRECWDGYRYIASVAAGHTSAGYLTQFKLDVKNANHYLNLVSAEMAQE